jgi:L-ascorbate metabolism protein UlaG (beta-lactamase superfamily)
MQRTQLTYIGGPTLRFTLGGVTFLTDPTFDPAGSEYTRGPVTLSKTASPALTESSIGSIDAVLLSHDHHSDNLDVRGRDVLRSAASVFTTPEGAARLGGNAIGLAPWQQRELTAADGTRVRMTATPGRHGPSGADRGPVTGFVLETPGAPTFYVSGDTVLYEGVHEIIRRFPGIEIAVLFLGAARVSAVASHITFTAAEAIDVARALPSATIVPVHYEGWKHFSESRRDIADAFGAAGLSERLVWLAPGEVWEPRS